MNMPKFSVIVWAADTNEMYFRDFLESMVHQVYDHWEMFILDENASGRLGQVAAEFFPGDVRVHYRQLQNHRGQAYGYNIGFHFGEGDYYVFVGQHDRLSANALFSIAEQIMLRQAPALYYSDHDELSGTDRVCPHFKPDLNRELLLRQNYIGNFLVVARQAAASLGGFWEKLKFAFVYEYYLRAVGAGVPVYHISSLLYHERDLDDVIENAPSTQAASAQTDREMRKLRKAYEESAYREHMAVVQAYLLRQKIAGEVVARNDRRGWNLNYDGSDYRRHRKEYMVLRDTRVKALGSKTREKFYGFLRQPKVAVVGAAFLGPGLTVDNTGYIFDRDGIVYPAFHGHNIFQDSYEHLALCPRDVSMVDFGYCMLDAKVYRGLNGFDPQLQGRDVMLDYCLRAAQAGYRVVVAPCVWARYRTDHAQSYRESGEYLWKKHQDILRRQDPFYNRNLPMGLENYRLSG